MDANIQELINALQFATSQDPAKVKYAEEWLRQKENEENFYLKLSGICGMHDIEWPARWMSVIYLKNGIDKCWRSCSSYSLSPDTKEQIRSNILQCLGEPVNQVAKQLFVVISKIARMDYPDQWQSLMPFLFSGISTLQDPFHQTRCLSALKHVIKTLSLKKLPHAKEVFSTFCNGAFDGVFQFWTSSHDLLTNSIQSEQGSAESLIENCVLNTKIILHMVQEYDRDKLTKLYEISFKNLYDITKTTQLIGGKQQEYCKKLSIVYIKILDALLSVGAQSYIMGAQKSMSLFCEYIHNHIGSVKDEIDEKFVVKCTNACKSIVDNPIFGEVFLEDSDFSTISPAFETLFQSLVSHYLPLKEQDLMSWEEDAEEFCCDEYGESWKYNIRPSAEMLSLTLLQTFPDLLVPSLLKMLEVVQDLSVDSVTHSDNNPMLQIILKGCTSMLECMVRKEAVYYMIGLAMYNVLEEINFEHWFMNKLLPEVNLVQNEAHGKLIHRRVLWLVSQFCEVQLTDSVRSSLYMFVVASMQKNFDMAVRITASQAMRHLLDDFEFDIAIFQDYQNGSFSGLYKLLLDVESCDTKMRILNVISFLIERLGSAVAPYAPTISGIIPNMWDHATKENHDMLKCAIMNMLIVFIYGLGEKSESITHLTIPLVRDSTDLNNPGHVYLLDDGLELWLAALQHCKNPNQEFFSLFTNVFPVLEFGSETLRTSFQIIESYALLYGLPFLREYGQKLDQHFTSLTTDVRNECLVLLSDLVSIFIQVSDESLSSCCLAYCKRSFEMTLSDSDSVLLSANFSLAAHICVKSTAIFLGIIKQIGKDHMHDFESVLQSFIKKWCDSIDTVVEIDKRKLSALALLSLSSNINEIPVVANVFANIVCAVVQIMYDVCDENGKDAHIHIEDGLFHENGDSVESQHDKRKREMRKRRIVCNASLPLYAAVKMESLQNAMSRDHFSQLMSAVDSDTVKEFKGFMSSH